MDYTALVWLSIILNVALIIYIIKVAFTQRDLEEEEERLMNEAKKVIESQKQALAEAKEEMEKGSPKVVDRFTYRPLLLETLKKMGCQPIEAEEDSKNVFFKFQGEAFCITQDRAFIRIWDLPFSEVHLLDTKLPLIIESINSANYNIGPTILLTEANEKGYRELQSKMDLHFTSSIPNPDQYLTLILHLFFDTKKELIMEIEKWDNPENQSKPSNLTTFPHQN